MDNATMNTLGLSATYRWANKTTRWVPGDDEAKYNHHMKKRFDIMQRNGWDGERGQFTYTFNSHGFRADEFTDEPSVMFLGCSMTMGVGIELENTWAHMVARDLGLKNHNLATGGSSNDACFRLFNHWHRIHKPKLVVYYSPPQDRLEVLNGRDKPIANLLPQNTAIDDFYKHWLLCHLNGEFNLQKNVLAVKYLCQENNIPLVWLHHNQMFITYDDENNAAVGRPGFEFIPYEYGRDLLHPGAGWHRNMHKRVMTMINEL